MMRDSITFVTFVRNDKDRLRALIETVRPHLGPRGEVLVVDQSSDDGTYEVACELADRVFKRTRKGYPDPDRNWGYAQAGNDWVFTCDTDELPDETLLGLLPRLADKSHGAHIFWLTRKNLVDGVDIFPILKEDWQPRLFKKNALRYGDRMHTHPQVDGPLQMWIDTGCIVHNRTMAQIEGASKNRALANDPEMQAKEAGFQQAVKSFLETGTVTEGA
jgi:glycosyltransferase involved in cell wall biosynthesis